MMTSPDCWQSAAGCEIPPAELKTFMDIVVLEDVWDWLR